MTVSDAPPAAPYAGREKWGNVARLTALGVLVAGMTVVAFAIPDPPPAILVLGAYGAFSTALLLVMAAANLATKQLPTLSSSEVEGQPVVGVKGWQVPWWPRVASNVADTVGLVLLGVLGLREGGEWTPFAVLVLLVAIWPAGRVVLALLGRRHSDALWVGADEVLGYDGHGSYRCSRGDVVKVIGGTESDTVIVVASHVERRPCPRPWAGRRRWADDELGLDCTLTAHDPEGLAAWLRTQIGVPDHRS